MALVNKSKLQKLIDRCVETGGPYYLAQAALNEYCGATYGVEPGDVDADGIIDAILGGCGMPSSMTADDFDAEMREKTGDSHA